MIFLIIFIVILLIFIISVYNTLVNLQKKTEQSKSTIDVYLKQRFDLIPNLVECVKGYAKHEQETLDKIITMRSNYFSSEHTLEDGAKLNNECDKILAIAENYPELKADEHFMKLQKNLIKLESQLQAARRIYNSDVTEYNTKVTIVPFNLVATIFGFKSQELFKLEENEKNNISINL